MKNRTALTRQITLILAACCIFSTGCTISQGIRESVEYNDSVNDFVLNWRNSNWSQRAWAEREHQFEGQLHGDDFKEGFRAGYTEIAEGGVGCLPTVPPRKYWSWRYQSPDGKARVDAWFAGYPEGVKAAQDEGIGDWSSINVRTAAVKPASQPIQAKADPAPRILPTPYRAPVINGQQQSNDISRLPPITPASASIELSDSQVSLNPSYQRQLATNRR